MKKTVILLCLVMLLCGCKNNENTTVKNGKDVIIFPTEQIAETVNGYKTESNVSSEESSGVLYIANISSKKFHLADCSFAKNIKEENILRGNNRNNLISGGYTPCKQCNP